MTNTVKTDVQKLAPGSVIDLFQLDATAQLGGGSILYFHPGVNELNETIYWDGQAYLRYPIDIEGFEYSTSGTLPKPKIKIANISGVISTLIHGNDDILGAKLTRIRTFIKYLDAVNFVGGVNPYGTPDPTCSFNDEVWFIDRKSSENLIYIEFELSSAFDVTGVKLPKRTCIQNVCTWRYRSAECGYAGSNYWNTSDAPVGLLSLDVCGKRLSSCKLRFPAANAPLPYGGFPGVTQYQ